MVTRFMPLPKLARAIMRDNNERDKVLAYGHDLDRIADELRSVLEWAEKPEGDAYLRSSEAIALLRSIVADT
jgi:hypothetical protein